MKNGHYHATAFGRERRVIVDSDRDREDRLNVIQRTVVDPLPPEQLFEIESDPFEVRYFGAASGKSLPLRT